MTFLILATVFLAVGLATAAAGSLVLARDPVVRRRLEELTAGGSVGGAEARLSVLGASTPTGLRKIVTDVGRRVPQSPDDVGDLRRQLLRAGYRDATAALFYVGIRILMGVALPLFMLATVVPGMPGTQAMVLLAASAGLGYVIPSFALGWQIRRRKTRITDALPDTLDLLVVCVEAGLGLNQALVRVGEEMRNVEPIVADELNLVSLEMRAGKPRTDALKNLAKRTGVDELTSLVSMLVQTDKFGTSLAKSLRVFSDSMRTKRRQKAEEAAAKTTIKMVFPLALCIMPALFVVILGPGALHIFEVLIKGQ